MGRPKTRSAPARLDLIIERKTKRDAFALAMKHQVSVGKLFELLVAAEKQRNGRVALQEWKELIE
jgi:hypothetical protein